MNHFVQTSTMAFAWLMIPLLVLMADSFREGPSQKSNRGVETPREASARHSFSLKEIKKDDFDKRIIVYENQADIENLNYHIEGFQRLVQTQGLEIALMLTLKKNVVLPQIRKFYHTFVKVNEDYYKVKWIVKHLTLGQDTLHYIWEYRMMVTGPISTMCNWSIFSPSL